MENIYPKLALCDSKKECARTDTVFFPISQVHTKAEILKRDFAQNLEICMRKLNFFFILTLFLQFFLHFSHILSDF